jgi:hypothetical protein
MKNPTMQAEAVKRAAGRQIARKRVNSKQSVARAGRRSIKKASRDPARPFRGAKVVSINIVVHQKGDDQWWIANAFDNKQNVVYSATRTTPSRAFLAVANGTGYGPDAFEKVTPNHYLLKVGIGRGRDPAPTGKVRCSLLLRRITKVAEESVRSKRIGTSQAILDSKGDWELVKTLKKTAQKAGCSSLQISEAVADGVQFGRKAVLGESFWKKSGRVSGQYAKSRDPGFKVCPVGTEVQYLILDQSHFDTRDAI